MDDKFTWKGEIQFEGSPEEFNALTAELEKTSLSVVERRFRWPRWPGLWPWPIWEFLGADVVKKLTVDVPCYRLEYLKGIAGGIRDPHLHLKGGEIAVLGREQFKAVMVEVATNLAVKQVDAGLDYEQTVAPFAAIPIQLP